MLLSVYESERVVKRDWGAADPKSSKAARRTGDLYSPTGVPAVFTPGTGGVAPLLQYPATVSYDKLTRVSYSHTDNSNAAVVFSGISLIATLIDFLHSVEDNFFSADFEDATSINPAAAAGARQANKDMWSTAMEDLMGYDATIGEANDSVDNGPRLGLRPELFRRFVHCRKQEGGNKVHHEYHGGTTESNDVYKMYEGALYAFARGDMHGSAFRDVLAKSTVRLSGDSSTRASHPSMDIANLCSFNKFEIALSTHLATIHGHLDSTICLRPSRSRGLVRFWYEFCSRRAVARPPCICIFADTIELTETSSLPIESSSLSSQISMRYKEYERVKDPIRMAVETAVTHYNKFHTMYDTGKDRVKQRMWEDRIRPGRGYIPTRQGRYKYIMDGSVSSIRNVSFSKALPLVAPVKALTMNRALIRSNIEVDPNQLLRLRPWFIRCKDGPVRLSRRLLTADQKYLYLIRAIFSTPVGVEWVKALNSEARGRRVFDSREIDPKYAYFPECRSVVMGRKTDIVTTDIVTLPMGSTPVSESIFIPFSATISADRGWELDAAQRIVERERRKYFMKYARRSSTFYDRNPGSGLGVWARTMIASTVIGPEKINVIPLRYREGPNAVFDSFV
jgi:hypothetical protein